MAFELTSSKSQTVPQGFQRGNLGLNYFFKASSAPDSEKRFSPRFNQGLSFEVCSISALSNA
jgi:hypothetical protein